MRASEQDRDDVREQRKQWSNKAPALDTDRLVFIDETGAKTNMTRLYGRACKGERAHDSAPSGHWCTTTLVAAVRTHGPCAPMLLEGAMNGDAFTAWVEKLLAPSLSPGDIVVMDNLSSHKNSAVQAVIEAKGATLVFLPPYSPDFNPIEKMWSKVKAILRGARARTKQALSKAVAKALNAVTGDDIKGWFQSCGYII